MLSYVFPSAVCTLEMLRFIPCEINRPETLGPTGRPSFLEGCHTPLYKWSQRSSQAPRIGDNFTPDDLAEGQRAPGH